MSAFKQAFVTCFEAALNSLLHLLTGDHEADHEIRKASKSRLTYEHPPVLDSLGEFSLLLLRSVILLPDEVSHTVTWTVWCCAPLCCGCPGRETIALPSPCGRLDSSGPSTASQCIMLSVACEAVVLPLFVLWHAKRTPYPQPFNIKLHRRISLQLNILLVS